MYHDFRSSKIVNQFGAKLVFQSCSSVPENFAIDEGQKLTKLRDLEIDFLIEELDGIFVKHDYCFGYFEGNRAEMDDLLVSLQESKSMCYVLTESRSKEKKHKRLPQTGR